MTKWLIESKVENQIVYISDSKKGQWLNWSNSALHSLMFDTKLKAEEHLKYLHLSGLGKITEHIFE